MFVKVKPNLCDSIERIVRFSASKAYENIRIVRVTQIKTMDRTGFDNPC